jgi:hypothetical protein
LARKDDFTGIPRFCLMCKTEIPPERKSDAITCSPECTKHRQAFLRSKRDAAICRYCYRPSTPEDRVRYNQWSKWEKKNGGNEEFSAQVLKVNRLVRENAKLNQRLAELEARTEGGNA